MGPMKKSATLMNRNSEDVPHEAVLTETTVHFTLTTHIGKNLDLNAAVRRLLSSDIAISAAWPSERGMRVTPSLRKLARSVSALQRLGHDLDHYQQKSSFAALARLTIKHPVALSRGIQKRRSKRESGLESSEANSESLSETLDFGIGVLLDAQKISSVEREIDARLFGGLSRDFDDFVRLNLRGSYHDIRVPGTADTFRVVFEPRVLLHRSGIVQLTIAVPIDIELTTSQLVRLSRSDTAIVAKSEVPEPLLVYDKSGRWMEGLDSGVRLYERTLEQDMSVGELLQEHLTASIRAIKARYRNQWNIHATVFGAAGNCCSTLELWRANHEIDVARIASRHEAKGLFDYERLLGPNLSIEQDVFLSANLGSTTKIDYMALERAPFDELNTVLIIEHVMLQYSRLQNIEDRVARPHLFGTKLQKLQHETIGVFTDMRQHELRYGSARTIASHLLQDLGAEEMRRTIETALALAAQANATHDARSQAHRSMSLTLIATVLAVLVSIPALTDLIKLAVDLERTSGPSWVLTPFSWLAGLGGWGPWIIVIILVSTGVLSWFVKRTWRVTHVSWRIARALFGRRGPKIPDEFTLTARLSDELGVSSPNSKTIG